MRVLLQHQSSYEYPEPALLGPHLLRLQPASHAKAKIETYSLTVNEPAQLRFQQDPVGNHVARLSYRKGDRVKELTITVEMVVDLRPVNPFDFFVDDECKPAPVKYPPALRRELTPYFELSDASLACGRNFALFVSTLPSDGDSVDLLVELNRRVRESIRYVIREEPGIWTPEETLVHGCGSCRDAATLLMTVLRLRGFAARFVSGYLVQLTDEGLLPDEPKGVDRDVVDLHAWTEVFLPGAGWIGLDATSGLLCGEGHIPLASAALPALASPVEGSSDIAARKVSFATKIARLGHEPRPTRPFADDDWSQMLAAFGKADAMLKQHGLVLTMGGEPTFNSRTESELPEWNGEALGANKWRVGKELAARLLDQLCPLGATIIEQGKWYPGEELPRWRMLICGRKDGHALWQGLDDPPGDYEATIDDARRLADAIALKLGVDGDVLPAFEDPWPTIALEYSLPTDDDPTKYNLSDSLERKRLARILSHGLHREVGYVLPLARRDAGWASDHWTFKREKLFLIPGDSPIGLRLPLKSLGGPETIAWDEEFYEPLDPRRVPDPKVAQKQKQLSQQEPVARTEPSVRTALCIEPRNGELHIFLPPLGSARRFIELLQVIDDARIESDIAHPARIVLEGHGPPPGPEIIRFSVTPDPGVLEVNLPVTDNIGDYDRLTHVVFDAALHVGLHSEKYMLDGRQQGSGGGNHLTFGGPTPLSSPFIQRPNMLASLLTFLQHHPSMSYLFSGLFVGPTSQAPRVDEARLDALDELAIALREAHTRQGNVPPSLSDSLFRHLLVDISGNTHRAEVSIDKLFDPGTPIGRQGLVELRAFEMPPHPRMSIAQMGLVRSLLATFAERPYQGELVKWGQSLHDRFLLPYFLWRDFEDVLEYLEDFGVILPSDAYRAFLDFRCPLVGAVQAGDVRLEVRNAIEPWPVLGEELSSQGTARYVDSSLERIEIRSIGLVPERHVVIVNGYAVPMHPTKTAMESVAGIRFRAWAPPHSMQPHLGIHHPLRLDVVDTWGKRSLAGCQYHVWHPEGIGYNSPPLTRQEAFARRVKRLTVGNGTPYPVIAKPIRPNPATPVTLDLRRISRLDRPMPPPDDDE